MVSKDSYVHIYSYTPIEDIEAFLKDGMAILDPEKRELAYVLNIQSLTFKNALMQEHFNENYLESDKYPKASFSGKIDNWSKTSGSSKATASGEMTIHGVTKEVSVEGDLVFTEDMVSISATFPIEVANYKIKIPKAVFYNIAEIVEVTVYFEYKPNE